MKKVLLFMLMLFMSLGGVNAVLDDAVVYYAFDDDNSGYDINGATGTNTSKLGEGAISFDGVNDYLESPSLALDTTISTSFWFKHTFSGSSEFMVSSSTSSTDKIWTVYQASSDNLIRVLFYNGATTAVGELIADTTYNDGNWHNLIFTQNGNNAELFIDGISVDNDTTTGKVGETHPLQIGAFYSTGTTGFYEGDLDEVVLYDRVLSPTEISDLYNSGAGELAKNVANDYLFYAPLDSLTDISDTGNDGTGNNGVTYTNSSLLGEGVMSFDGVNDDVSFSTISDVSKNHAYSVSGWIYVNSATSGNLVSHTLSTSDRMAITYNSAGDIRFSTYNGASFIDPVSGSLSTGAWHHIAVTYDGVSNNRMFIDNTEVFGTNTPSTSTIVGGYLGSNGGGAVLLNGSIDEFGVWNRTLTTDEIAELYNGGLGLNPYAPISGTTITFNNPTNGAYLDNTSFLLNVSFSELTNSSYILNGGNETTLCNNCNESSDTTLIGVEGANTLTVFTNTSGTLNNETINFTIDVTKPVIVDNLPTEINSYVLDFNSSTCTDTNIDTCVLNIESTNYDLLTVTNATLTINGNSSYTITATDLAGNSANTSGVVFVNPYQYWYFEDSLSNPITNFTFNGVNFTDYAQFKTYDLGLGTSTLTFEKVGYQTQNFNVTLTNTSNINQTYTISDAKIVINMREKATGNLITTDTFTAEFIATVGATANTSTGQLNVSNVFFLNEDYIVTITSNNYLTEQLFFTFSNQEILELDAYFIEKNSTSVGTVFIKVVDLGSKPVKGAKVFAQQWDAATSSFIAVTQGITGEDGLASLSVILNDENYKFSANKDGATGESVVEIIDTTENGKTITIPLDSGVAVRHYFLQNLEYTVTESFNNVTNVSTITVDWTNTDGLSTNMCITRYRTIANSEKFQEESCTSGVSGTLIQGYFINSSNVVTLKAEVKYNGAYVPLESFTYSPETSPSKLLLNLGLAPFVIPILFMISIGIGLYIENLYIGTMLLAISSGLSLLLVPTLTNGGITAFLFFMGWMIIQAGVKPR